VARGIHTIVVDAQAVTLGIISRRTTPVAGGVPYVVEATIAAEAVPRSRKQHVINFKSSAVIRTGSANRKKRPTGKISSKVTF
jgi:hypothetical protein